MKPTFSEFLTRNSIILDGAWGTELQKRGIPSGGCTESLNLSHREFVESVASSYVEAGSDIILTNTFGGNRFALDRHDMGDKCVLLNRAGVKISRDAAGQKALVMGSMGPTGKMLLMGEVTSREIFDVYREQADALAEAGVDGVVIETMSDLEETRLAVAAVRETGLPVVACMVYDAGENLDRTMMGTTPAEQASALMDADVLGANCGHGIKPYTEVCRQLRKATRLPLWMKPNAGIPELIEGKTVFSMTPEQFAAEIVAIHQAGASFMGGCCGTSPEFIVLTKKKLRDMASC